MKKTNRKILGSSARGPRQHSGETWLSNHPEALAFAKDWLELRREGRTDWSARKVLDYIREHFGYPYNSEQRFYGLVERAIVIAAKKRKR